MATICCKHFDQWFPWYRGAIEYILDGFAKNQSQIGNRHLDFKSLKNLGGK
jgi:hypothetical protein